MLVIETLLVILNNLDCILKKKTIFKSMLNKHIFFSEVLLVRALEIFGFRNEGENTNQKIK